MIRVLLADDQSLVRAGFRVLLETAGDLEVVGEAATGEQALAQAATVRPDVVLMDFRLPGMDGVQATTVLKEARPDIGVVVLTASANSRAIEELNMADGWLFGIYAARSKHARWLRRA